MEKLVIDEELYLSSPTDEDMPALVEYLNDENLFQQTLRVPKPYTRKDAQDFLNASREKRKQHGRTLNWIIRRTNGHAIGGLSFQLTYGSEAHKDTIGYWIAQPYRGHGIMARALKRFCEYGINYVGLIRIEAIIFEDNAASARVLEKAGFANEGLMKKFFEKKGKYIDGRMYALVK